MWLGKGNHYLLCKFGGWDTRWRCTSEQGRFTLVCGCFLEFVEAQDRIEILIFVCEGGENSRNVCLHTKKKYYRVLYENSFYTSLEKILLLTTGFEVCRSVAR